MAMMEAVRQLIAARLDRGRNTVALYRALGNRSNTPERTPSP